MIFATTCQAIYKCLRCFMIVLLCQVFLHRCSCIRFPTVCRIRWSAAQINSAKNVYIDNCPGEFQFELARLVLHRQACVPRAHPAVTMLTVYSLSSCSVLFLDLFANGTLTNAHGKLVPRKSVPQYDSSMRPRNIAHHIHCAMIPEAMCKC